MGPSIQYVRTSDGIDIAYYVAGSGPPFMIMEQATESNIQTDWDNDDLRARYEMIARSLFASIHAASDCHVQALTIFR